MFTFLKNRFVQIAVATVGGERITASTALNQQQQKFSATAAAGEWKEGVGKVKVIHIGEMSTSLHQIH
jgi:hypothetical protein